MASVAALKRGMATLVPQGTGGRASVSGLVVTVFGATGFLGRYVVNRFGRIGSQLVVPYRGDDLDTRHLRPMADLGCMHFSEYKLLNEKDIRKLVEHSNVVVNLIGRDHDTRNFTLDDVHIDAPRMIARCAREAGVSRFIHVSALGADKLSSSKYLSTKAYGEENVLKEFPSATILRPATMIGVEDRFFNKLALLRTKGAIPLPNNGAALKKPVYVGDVAHAILNAAQDKSTQGKTYEFVGPREMSMLQLANYVCDAIRVEQRTLPLPALANPILGKVASYLELSPWKPLLTQGDVVAWSESDQVDWTTGRLEDLGITPTNMDKVALSVLRRYRTYLTQEQTLE